MRIIRFYEDNTRAPRTIKRGLTEAEAKKWCQDPETSSYTAQPPLGCGGDDALIAEWHGQHKHWFDGFDRETSDLIRR